MIHYFLNLIFINFFKFIDLFVNINMKYVDKYKD